jgi:dienelactone hydrolase
MKKPASCNLADDLEREEYEVLRDGLAIRGTLVRNSGSAPKPIAIACHEFMLDRTSQFPYAALLAENGYAVFTFDFTGDSVKGKSDGDSRNLSILTQMADIEAVLHYAQSRPDTIKNETLLLGCSEGGLAAALEAPRLAPGEIKNLVLIYAGFSMPGNARMGTMLGSRFDPNHIPETFSIGAITLGPAYAADVQPMYMADRLRGYWGNVLLLHGSEDRIVSVALAREAEQIYREEGRKAFREGKISSPPRVRLRVLPGAHHLFLRAEDKAATREELQDFLDSVSS